MYFQDPFESLPTKYRQDLGGELVTQTVQSFKQAKMELASFVELLFSYVVMQLTVPEQEDTVDYSAYP